MATGSVKGEVTFDVEELRKDLERISNDADATLASILNDAAFDLRQTWGQLLTSEIDNPTPFSKKTFVEKATKDNLVAEVYIPPIQSEYLSLLLEGGTRKPGDYGTYPNEILSPVDGGVKLNARGNFPAGGPKRWLGAVADGEIKNTFVGTVRDGGQRAVYQQYKQKSKLGQLKLLAVFVDTMKYDKTITLDKATEKFSQVFFDKVSSRLDELLR